MKRTMLSVSEFDRGPIGMEAREAPAIHDPHQSSDAKVPQGLAPITAEQIDSTPTQTGCTARPRFGPVEKAGAIANELFPSR